jgi:hypothetical protein
MPDYVKITLWLPIGSDEERGSMTADMMREELTRAAGQFGWRDRGLRGPGQSPFAPFASVVKSEVTDARPEA